MNADKRKEKDQIDPDDRVVSGDPGKEERLRNDYMKQGLTPGIVRRFRNIIRTHYRISGRKQPWRETRDPYSILVSELMLQQTTVERVMDKYSSFIARFPGFERLARADTSDVLREWQGLGYNRRALNLRKLARQVMSEYGGVLPPERDKLLELPGIGPYTAGAVLAFAFNLPDVIIETNIRRVFIHFFFPGTAKVHDTQILPIVERTLDRKDPRSWYYGLMDYGTDLAGRVPNPNKRSRHYTRQSPFEGSHRQIRSRILRAVLDSPGIRPANIAKKCRIETGKVKEILRELKSEGFPV